MRTALKRIATALGALSAGSKLLLAYGLVLVAVYLLAALRVVHLAGLLAGLLGLISGALCGLTFWHRARVEIGRRKLKYRNIRRITGITAAAGISLFVVSYSGSPVIPVSAPVSTAPPSAELAPQAAPPYSGVGWSIMFPPLTTRSGVIYMKPNVDAPLTEWRPMQLEKRPAYDSERACENFRSKMIAKAKDFIIGAPPDLEQRPLEKSETAGKWIFAMEANQSRCIASNDPGLNGQ